MNRALFRHRTSDAAIWENVVDRNEYRFGQFTSNDLCLDIGANTGAATYAMLQHGAGKVIAFEPDPDNYAIFRKQLKNEIFNGLVEVYPLAVVGGSDFSWRTFSGVVRSDGQINHGGAFLFTPEGGDHGLGEFVVNRPFQVPCIGFDRIPIPNNFTARLVKMDCEGSEWDILSKNDMWPFASVVGEYHPFDTFGTDHLQARLPSYKVEVAPHPNSTMGLFFAHRLE